MNEKLKKANKITAIGAGQIIGGGLLILVFGIINLILGLFSLASGILTIFGMTIAAGSVSPLLFFIGLVIGGIIIWRGATNVRLASGFRKVSKIIDDNPVISLLNLEKRVYWSRKKLLSELKRQRKNGFWPGSYIDMTGDVFVLDYVPVSEKAADANPAQEDIQSTAETIIEQLRITAGQIQDENLKTHVERLSGIAGQIYSYVAGHPEKAGIVRQLSNYFLPTTVELLKRYLELQSQTVRTDAMNEAMRKIAEVMVTIEAVFKNQLDAVYSEKVMDVDVEIEVLQNMAGV